VVNRTAAAANRTPVVANRTVVEAAVTISRNTDRDLDVD